MLTHSHESYNYQSNNTHGEHEIGVKIWSAQDIFVQNDQEYKHL